MRIYSATDPTVLLHTILRRSEFGQRRVDASPPEERLQVAQIGAAARQTYRPHIHLSKMSTHDAPAQETWIVIAGRVEVTFYDLDEKPLTTAELGPGDCSITHRGGHGYRVLDEGALIYEVKSGPYLGQAADKKFLEGA